MVNRLRIVLAAFGVFAATGAHAVELAYEPIALGWSSDEVEQATAENGTAIAERAQQLAQLGCSRYCERLERIFARLVTQARGQTERARRLPWSLTVVRLNDVQAMALPGGQVVVSEAFIARLGASDAELAFVLAHEMAHSILEHERQALTFARMLLPRNVSRSVSDMYVEMSFNFALLKAMEPAMQEGEFEADELGLLLASAAGYAPEQQIEFMEREAGEEPGAEPLIATHPPASERLARLRMRLPLAQRLLPLATD